MKYSAGFAGMQSEELRSFFDQSLDTLFIVDKEGRIVEANLAACEILKLSRDEVVGKNLIDFVPSELSLAAETALNAVNQAHSFSGEFPLSTEDDESIPFDWRARKGNNDGISFWSGRNITNRRTLENRLRVEVMNKEMLLREAHHSIKNSLQNLVSLLNLEGRIQDATWHEVLTKYNQRVRSLALIYDVLFATGGNSMELNLSDYIEQLAKSLFSNFHLSEEQVRLVLNLTPVSISYERALPCGLIANEIISNALQYAFVEGKRGELKIEVGRAGNIIMMNFSDNGVGVPETVRLDQNKTLGLRIVRMFVTQLRGKITLDRHHGTLFHIEIPA